MSFVAEWDAILSSAFLLDRLLILLHTGYVPGWRRKQIQDAFPLLHRRGILAVAMKRGDRLEDDIWQIGHPIAWVSDNDFIGRIL